MLDEKGKVEREVVAMKRALCFFLAIVFVCCVIVHGKNERFSIEAMITNLTNFEDMPTFDDIAECWRSPYEWVGDTYFLPRADYCSVPPVWDIQTNEDGSRDFVLVADGIWFYDMPIALDSDGNDISAQYPDLTVTYNTYYDPITKHPSIFVYGGKSYTELPYLTDARTLYERNTPNDILDFFENIRGFFRRLSNTISLIFEMFYCVLKNVKYLLPWNSTVPK